MTLATPAEMTLAVLEMAQVGQFGEIWDLFAPSLRQLVTVEALQVAWSSELERRGPVLTIGVPVSERAVAGVVVVRVPVICERGALTMVVSVTEKGFLASIQLAPAAAAEPIAPWEPPSYTDPDTFDEQDVTVGSGSLAVTGTLTVPHRPGQCCAVVLLGGSGVLDRDETVGRNKPFKDLAWGLATRGVGVLRFDKVTFAHPGEVKKTEHFTLADEYLPHAVAAVHLLRQHPAFDAERIILVGHSLGGTVAPRVAASESAIAGLVILAGGAQPLHWNMVRQVRYLASLAPETAATSGPAIKALTEQARLIDSPQLSASTPNSDLPFGTPASYWLDLRTYDPVEVATTLDEPILILQGGRDYQVTVEDDLKRWQVGLMQHPHVTIRVYPADNHLFFSGSGQSSPAEYEPVQHMDSAVVADIADWLTADDPGGSWRAARR